MHVKFISFPIFFVFFTSCVFTSRNAGQIASRALLAEAENLEEISETYSDAFKNDDFSEKKISKLTDEELDYAWTVVASIKKEYTIPWLENIFKEIEKRLNPANINIFQDKVSWFVSIYTQFGMWEKAYSLQAKYKQFGIKISPEKLIYGTDAGIEGWRVLTYSQEEKTAEVKYSGLNRGDHLVLFISEGCGFSKMAIESIVKNDKLKKIIAEYGTVITDSFNYQWAEELKRNLKIDRIYSSYSEKEIKGIAGKGSPHMLFLHNGSIVFETGGVDPENTAEILLKDFNEGLEALINAKNNNEVTEDRFINGNIIFESRESKDKNTTPLFVDYADYLSKPWDMYVLGYIDTVVVLKGCLRFQSFLAMCWNKSEEDCDNIRNKFRFCVPDKNNSAKPFSIRKLLKGVLPAHKIEFARSIITKDGHIISAYMGGIKKDLGEKKAKEIAQKLAGQSPQFDTACEITENAGTGTKTINAVSKKGYFCLAE